MTDKITAEDVHEIDDEATALILTIMQQNARNAAYTTERLMEGYRKSASESRAELNAVRWRIRKLFDSGFMPTQERIFDAMWPTQDEIESFMEDLND
jgi:hypothetical protein